MNRTVVTLYDKFQCPIQDIGDLFIFVAVQRYRGAFAQDDPGEHGSFSCNKLAIDQRVEVFDRHVIESYMLKFLVLLFRGCTHTVHSCPFARAQI